MEMFFIGIIVIAIFVVFPIYVFLKITSLQDSIRNLEKKYVSLRAEYLKANMLDNISTNQQAQAQQTPGQQTQATPNVNIVEKPSINANQSVITIPPPLIQPKPIATEIKPVTPEPIIEATKTEIIDKATSEPEIEQNKYLEELEEETITPSPIDQVKYTAPTREPRNNYARPEPKPERGAMEWEALIGGKYLNRIGAVAIIIAMGFFLKYAFDNNWINEYMRVGIGVLTGAGLVAGGMYSHKKDMRIFSQGLLGAGISILFTSVFAAFNFYHLLSQIPSIIAMSCVTGLSVWLGLKYDSKPMIFIGWFGGFATPFLISTGQANDYGLWGYLFAINLVFVSLSVVKDKLRILYPFTTIAILCLMLFWRSNFYFDGKIIFLIAMSSIFWILYLCVEYYYSLGDKPGAKIILASHFVNSAVLFIFNFTAIYNVWHKTGSSIFSCIVAIIYLGIFISLFNRAKYETIIQYFIYFAALILTSILLGFSQKYNIILVACLGSAGLFYWNMKKLEFVKLASLAYILVSIFCLIVFKEMYSLNDLTNYLPIINFRSPIFAAVIGAILISEYLMRGERIIKSENSFSDIAYSSAYILLFLFVSCESSDWFGKLFGSQDYNAQMTLNHTTPIWLALSAAAMVFAFNRKTDGFKFITVFTACGAFFITTVLYFSRNSYVPYIPIIHYRFFMYAINCAIFGFVTYYLYNFKGEDRTYKEGVKFFELMISISGLLVISVEASDYLPRLFSIDGLGNYPKTWLLISGIWQFYSAANLLYAFKRKNALLFFKAGLMVCVSFFMTIVLAVGYSPISEFVPVLNYRFAFIMFGLLAFALNIYIMHKNDELIINLKNIVKYAVTILILCVLFIASVETNDYFSRIAFSGINEQALANNENTRQLFLSGVWIIYSIMCIIAGFIKRNFKVRIIGIVLIIISTLKVFIYDLNFLDSLSRIISFIILGVILIAASFMYQKYKGALLKD